MGPQDAEAAVAQARRLAAVQGPAEAQGLQQAVDLIRPVLAQIPDASKPQAARLLWRAGFYEEADALGDLATLGRICVETGQPQGLLSQFPKVRSDPDRLELLRLHGQWGEGLARQAAANPISPPAGAARDRLRVGVLSSDLRQHVVGHLVHPLFRWVDPDVELFAYSTGRQAPDPPQDWFASRARRFARLPDDDRRAAEIIAADDLDALVDAGGPTSSNQPGILAYAPAPLQLSWLGYPHPLGIPAVDGMILDPRLAPRPELMLEPAVILPRTWLAMSPAAFQPEPRVHPELPAIRRGFPTFATANDPYKLNPDLLRIWARILAAVPGARFRLIRYEAAGRSLRENIARQFAAEGIEAERLEFPEITGHPRALYNDVDVALDTFPMCGGMTTCEALWMGVPTVSLCGEAVFERLGASILFAAGLSDLVATSVDDYVRIAVGLALDRGRLAELRRTMRERIASHPLGQPEAFASDVFGTIRAQAQAR